MSKLPILSAAALAGLIASPALAGGEQMNSNMFNHQYVVMKSTNQCRGYAKCHSAKDPSNSNYYGNYNEDKSFKENVKGKYHRTKNKVKNKMDRHD